MDNKIKTTWVVVAHQAGARFMEHQSGFGRHLVLVGELEHPEARLRNQEIDSDRAGEASAGGSGTSRRAMQHEQTAHEHVVSQFARTIAADLSRSRAEGLFDAIILVAEPGFLGILRDALDKPTAQIVVDSVHKNLAVERPNEVAAHLGNVLPL